MEIAIKWELGYSNNQDETPTEWIRAVVPGAVQLDYIREKKLPDYNQGENCKNYRWMQEKYWTYVSKVDFSEVSEKHAFLVVEGIDYEYQIFADNQLLLHYEGLYKKHILDLSSWIGKSVEIKVLVYPLPKSEADGVNPGTRDEANQCTKPAVSYGWDFHPRLIPIGIWEEIYIRTTNYSSLPEPEVTYELSSDRKKADIHFSGGFADSVWKFYDTNGNLLFDKAGATVDFQLDSVLLWWCNGYGKQNLYRWKLQVGNEYTYEGKIGFKTIELVKDEETWRELHRYPMSRNTPPITVCLNGKNIFAKGINWVAPEIFYGTLWKGRYEEQLKYLKDANLNYLRSWGGAIINKESFFELCDEMGILVWQEFPLACNCYHGTRKYLQTLRNEAEAIIRRVRKHVSLMLWCGGNELFNSWSKMTDQSIALRLLNALTLEQTPEIPFLPTAPVMGMAHGAYSFLYEPEKEEVFSALSRSRYTAYTEIGIPAFSNMDTLRMIADEDRILDPEISELHNREHFDMAILNRYFGEVTDLSEMVEKSQYLQSIGYQFVYEEARRQKPYCSMVGAWCFNEPWPCVDNNCLINYPNSVRPAYYKVKAACRPVLASAKIEKLSYRAGEMLEFDLWLLNDSFDPVKDGVVKVLVLIGGHKEELLTWGYKNVPIHCNVPGPRIRYMLPDIRDVDTLQIVLEDGERSSDYTLLYETTIQNKKGIIQLNALDD